MPFPKLPLPLKKLESLFSEQLRLETDTTITVQSVEKAPKLTRAVLHAVRAPPYPAPPHHLLAPLP